MNCPYGNTESPFYSKISCGLFDLWHSSCLTKIILRHHRRQAVYSRRNTKLTINLTSTKPGSHCKPFPSLGDRHDSHVTQCSIKRERYEYKMTEGAI